MQVMFLPYATLSVVPQGPPLKGKFLLLPIHYTFPDKNDRSVTR